MVMIFRDNQSKYYKEYLNYLWLHTFIDKNSLF